MAQPPPTGSSTRVSRLVKAPHETVYQAFVDADAVAAWLPPSGMRGHVHAFDPREGGAFRLSLTYEHPATSPAGKTTEDTDTVRCRFVELVPSERIVEVCEFETDKPELAGAMRITVTLQDAVGGTEVTMLHEGIPPGVRLEDNEAGGRSSLENLAAFVER
jgi:uncharacterized protein YndB with AHSA1/START domain